tara:strand:- start:1138 stop:1395 length:258 start_codon:yes stop_codon:yes gene_type:complete
MIPHSLKRGVQNMENQIDWLFAGVGHRPQGEKQMLIAGYNTEEELRAFVRASLDGGDQNPEFLLWMIGASFRNFIQEELDRRAEV